MNLVLCSLAVVLTVVVNAEPRWRIISPAESPVKRARVRELFGKRGNGWDVNLVKRARELFGKRNTMAVKRRGRELFGKRSDAEMIEPSHEEVSYESPSYENEYDPEELTYLLKSMRRERRGRVRELLG